MRKYSGKHKDEPWTSFAVKRAGEKRLPRSTNAQRKRFLCEHVHIFCCLAASRRFYGKAALKLHEKWLLHSKWNLSSCSRLLCRLLHSNCRMHTSFSFLRFLLFGALHGDFGVEICYDCSVLGSVPLFSKVCLTIQNQLKFILLPRQSLSERIYFNNWTIFNYLSIDYDCLYIHVLRIGHIERIDNDWIPFQYLIADCHTQKDKICFHVNQYPIHVDVRPQNEEKFPRFSRFDYLNR